MVPELQGLEDEERLDRMDAPSLKYRRARGDMIDTYNYTHAEYTVNEEDLVKKRGQCNSRPLFETTKEIQQKCNKIQFL